MMPVLHANAGGHEVEVLKHVSKKTCVFSVDNLLALVVSMKQQHFKQTSECRPVLCSLRTQNCWPNLALDSPGSQVPYEVLGGLVQSCKKNQGQGAQGHR